MKQLQYSLYKISKTLFLFLSLTLIINSALHAEKKINAVVSIPPQKIFLSEISSGFVDITVLVGAGQSPATYEPTPGQMAALSSADIYFRIGVPFENRLISKITAMFPELKIVDLRDGIELHDISGHEHGDQIHEGAKDPHIWMDPILVKKQAGTILETISIIMPENKPIFEKYYYNFIAQLDTLDNTVKQIIDSCNKKEFLIFHPTLGYFANRYGLNQIPIEYDGKEPGAKYITELIKMAEKNNITTIFAQPQFSDKSARV
ncbi:MAG: zinc ABC transporter substrate-binding protein, partial [Candidatus Zixiibacteriota bacterium]